MTNDVSNNSYHALIWCQILNNRLWISADYTRWKMLNFTRKADSELNYQDEGWYDLSNMKTWAEHPVFATELLESQRSGEVRCFNFFLGDSCMTIIGYSIHRKHNWLKQWMAKPYDFIQLIVPENVIKYVFFVLDIWIWICSEVQQDRKNIIQI